MKNNHQRVPRGDVQGWSEGATRRNTEFLMSVRTDQLTGAGVALTLTLRDCPPTADDWHKLRRAWEKRMVRPVWFGSTGSPSGSVAASRTCIAPSGFPTPTTPSPRPAHGWKWPAPTARASVVSIARIIDGPVGWFQYLAKHAARGVKHYQRTADSIPEGWQKDRARVGKSRPLAGAGKRSVLTFRISTATVGGSPTGVSSAAGGWPMPGQQGMRTASGQRGPCCNARIRSAPA